MGIQLPNKGGTAAPEFSAHVCCIQIPAWTKMPLGMEVGLGHGHIVLNGTPKGQSPPTQFSAHVCCGETAGWIKMSLGREVGLGVGHIALDGAQLPSPEGAQQPPNFRPMSVVAKRLYGSRCHLVWMWHSAQAALCYNGTQHPTFRPISTVAKRTVAKRLDGSRCRGLPALPSFTVCPQYTNVTDRTDRRTDRTGQRSDSTWPTVFTARRNARVASTVLATAIPSVCLSVCPSVRPSVTRWYCVKTTARSTVLSDSKMCLVL